MSAAQLLVRCLENEGAGAIDGLPGEERATLGPVPMLPARLAVWL